METSLKKRPKRRKSKTPAAGEADADIELAEKTNISEQKDVVNNPGDDNKTWIETEDILTEKPEKTKRSKKKSEKKLKEVVESIESVKSEETAEAEKDVEVKEETETEDTSVSSKKKRFGFKLPDIKAKSLNPLKLRKKRSESEEKREAEKETENIESEVRPEESSTEDNKTTGEIKDEELNDEERSEAENVIHELPSASSGEKKDEHMTAAGVKKLSAKEKLKQKLDKKKSSEREPARLLRHLSTQSSRLEDRLKEEDNDAQIAFDRHDTVMKKKREKISKEITAEDAYDFFTAAWEDNPLEEVVVEKKTDKKERKKKKESEDDSDGEEGYETANEELDEGDDKKKLFAKDYIGSQYEWEVTEWSGPEILSYTSRVENEREIYYTPSPFPPTPEELQQVRQW